LQKSIALTPLLPRAGPTGGEGVALPAPTISLTIWSVAANFLDMLSEIKEMKFSGLGGPGQEKEEVREKESVQVKDRVSV
jgi:hypothetical protein